MSHIESQMERIKSRNNETQRLIAEAIYNSYGIQNEEQRRKYRENYGQGIVPAIDVNGSIKVRGTILHNDSLLKTLIDHICQYQEIFA